MKRLLIRYSIKNRATLSIAIGVISTRAVHSSPSGRNSPGACIILLGIIYTGINAQRDRPTVTIYDLALVSLISPRIP